MRVSAVSDADPETMKDVGNKLRRNFEILVHRIARHLSVGGIEESHLLLSQLDNSSSIYRNAKQGADSILNEMMGMVTNERYKDTELGIKISEKLTRYKIDLTYFQQILRQMELFQKVALHPSSHATVGAGVVSPVHKKELIESARILKELCGFYKRIEAHEEALF